MKNRITVKGVVVRLFQVGDTSMANDNLPDLLSQVYVKLNRVQELAEEEDEGAVASWASMRMQEVQMFDVGEE